MGTKAYPTNPLPANSGKTHRSRAGRAGEYAQRSIDDTPRELDNGGSVLVVQSAGQTVADQSSHAGAFPGSRKPLEPDQMSASSSKPATKSWYPQFMFRKARGKSRTSTGANAAEKVRNYWEKGETKDVDTEELTEEDTIIALMGPTGTGKSSFISTAVDQDKGIGHSLESCTSEISAVRVQVPGEDFGLVLVDTPGFDDTHKSDLQILELISDWLERTGRKRVLLSGILYLHRISDNRMAGTPLKNLKMFEKLCGHNASSHIVMVTTMWDELGEDKIGDRREDELKNTFWAPMLKRGSTIERYKNTKESAWNILEHFLGAPRERQELRLQRELIDMERTLPSTAAGKELSKTINDFVKKQGSLMRTLQEQMSKPDMDKDVMALLRGQYDELERQRGDLLKDVDVLRVPIKKKLREALTSIPPRYLRWFKQEPQSQTSRPAELAPSEPTPPPATAPRLPNPSRAPSHRHDEPLLAGRPPPPVGNSSVHDQTETKQGERSPTQQQPPTTPPPGGQKSSPSQPPPVPDYTGERPPEPVSLAPTVGPASVPPELSANATTAPIVDNDVIKLQNPCDTKSEGQTPLRFPSDLGQDSSHSQRTPHHPGPNPTQDRTSTKAVTGPSAEPQPRGSLDTGTPPRAPILNNVTPVHSNNRQNEHQPVSYPPPKGTLEATAPLLPHTINAPFIQSPAPSVVGPQTLGTIQAPSVSGSLHEISRPIQGSSSEAKGHRVSGGAHPPKLARETAPVQQPSYTSLSPQPTLNPVLPPHVLPSSASSSSLSLAPKSAQAPVTPTNTPPSKGPRNPKRNVHNHTRSFDTTSGTRNVPQVPVAVAPSRTSLDSSQHVNRSGVSDSHSTSRPQAQELSHPMVTPAQAPIHHPSHTPPESVAPPLVESESDSEPMRSQEPKRSLMDMIWGRTR